MSTITANTRASVWYMYMLAIVRLFTILLGLIGYILCFEATTIGGWLPFMLILVGPMLGWVAARLTRL